MKKYLCLFILILVFVSGCTQTTTQDNQGVDGQQSSDQSLEISYDAISVWQHKGSNNDWDIWYSIWDDAQELWFTPPGGIADPILILPGEDNDPDVSSWDNKAIAVWSHKDGREFEVYYSFWKEGIWEGVKVLRKFVGNDYDPTVAMGKDKTVVVWVRDAAGKRELYYSVWNGSNWSGPRTLWESSNLVLPESPSLPELSYSSKGVFTLVWTAKLDVGGRAFVSQWNGTMWTNPMPLPKQTASAVIDTQIPTVQRTGSTSSLASKYAVVWPTESGKVYSSLWNKTWQPSVNYGVQKMPDVAYNNTGTVHSLFANNNEIWHSKDLKSNAGGKALDTLDIDNRPALDFILNKSIGLAVWWATTMRPSEVYFSRYNGSWSDPEPIDPSIILGDDKNPALTPLGIVEPTVAEFCGDGQLQAGEQCEIGIACKNPNERCDITICKCVEEPKQTFCGDGILQNSNSFGFNEECEIGVACKDPTDFCDTDWCLCYSDYNPPEREDLSCVKNAREIANGSKNAFNSKKQICKDDCDPKYECNSKECVCEKIEVSCAKNTETDSQDVFNSSKAFCKNDCSDGYECNSKECVCEKQTIPKKKVYCYQNTSAVDKTDVNPFTAETMYCSDNCQTGYECVISSCTCVKESVGPDADSDGITDSVDNCKNIPNKYQQDTDKDGVGDHCDNCIQTSNANQADSDGDGLGDVCDGEFRDSDSDGISNDEDNCPYNPNANQADSDGDGLGNVCDSTPDGETQGPADSDGDGITDSLDNCPYNSNANQADNDQDGLGNVCDSTPDGEAGLDSDGDGIVNGEDNCVSNSNADQADSDGDGLGNACDSCPSDASNDADSDGVCGNVDNCPSNYNPNQSDMDGDGQGDPCDSTPVNCSQFCSENNYGAAIDENIPQEQCTGRTLDPQTCKTTCTYIYYQSWSNWSCCCRQTEVHDCTDCPGQNPYCPTPDEVCKGRGTGQIIEG